MEHFIFWISLHTLLHSLPEIELQSALEQTVTVLSGSGGRLYMREKVSNVDHETVSSVVTRQDNFSNYFNVYTCGSQPVMPETARYPLMEQYCVWQDHYKSGEYEVWAISDIYQIPELRNLQAAFRPTKIRSMLIMPLLYRQQLLGYLSIFRDEIERDTLWAGQFDPDQRQLYPRQSFEIWRESKKAQAREWTGDEIELAQQLGKQFASAIHEFKLTQQIHLLNTNLESQPQGYVDTSQQVMDLQQMLLEVVAKIGQSVEMDSIFRAAIKKLRTGLKADRVAIYKFKPNSGHTEGEIVSEDVSSNFVSAAALQIRDNCFQETSIAHYSQGRVRAIADIHNARLNDCYVGMLNQLQVKASLVVPLVKDNDLWGLLCIHQCSQIRHWKTSDIQFATLAGNLLSLALQKTDLLNQIQSQVVDLRVVTAQKQILFELLSKMGHSVNLT